MNLPIYVPDPLFVKHGSLYLRAYGVSGTPVHGDVPTWNTASGYALWSAGGTGTGVTDGDKGDITVSGSGSTWTVDSNAITDGKLRNSAAVSVIGRSANSTGTPADIVAANNDEFLRRRSNTVGFGSIISSDLPSGIKTVGIAYVIDGASAVISTGLKGWLEVPFACTITAARLVADQTGSIVINIWKVAYTGVPATATNSICASAKPTLTAAIKSEDTTLTGWTTSIAAGDWLYFNVDSVTTIQRVTLSLTVTKT